MQKQWQFLSYLVIALLLIASAPSSAQVVHEDPADIYPSNSISTNDEMNYLLNYMQGSLEAISFYIKAGNFTNAENAYTYYNYSVNAYEDLLWRMNLTQSDYEAIAANIDFTRDEVYNFIQNSKEYNLSYMEYTQALAAGNDTGASSSAINVATSYGNLTTAYDNFRSNATIIEGLLQKNNIDTSRFENTLNNIYIYISDLSVGYDQKDLNNNGKDLNLRIDPDSAPIGSNVTLTVTFKEKNDAPLSYTVVNIYFNNLIAGKITTDASGAGYLTYTIPADIISDRIQVHAESLPINGSRAYSNEVILTIPDKVTELSMMADKDTLSYGDTATFSGVLSSADGTRAPKKTIVIYANDDMSGTTTTGDNGTYSFKLSVFPDSKAGKYNIYSSYVRKPNGVFLNSTSQIYVLNIQPKYTRLTIDNNTNFGIGDMAHVKGTLLTEDGIPISGGNVVLNVDGVQYGNNTTVNGVYDVIIWIPDNSSVGAHELYASFDPGEGKALRASSSDRSQVAFEGKVIDIDVDSMPMVLFKNDTLIVNGTLSTGSGMPIGGKTLGVNVSDSMAGLVKTDGSGRFNATYVVLGTEPVGYSRVSVNDVDSNGQPSSTLYSGQVLVIPFEKINVVGVPAVLLVIIGVIAAFLYIRRKPKINVIKPEWSEPASRLTKSDQKPAVVLPAWTLAEAENNDEAVPPAPFQTSPAVSTPSDTTFEPRPQPKHKHGMPLDFSIDDEISSIKSTINEGNLKDALTHIYVASRKLAMVKGLDISDSMTHTEFYHNIKSKHPSLSGPLTHIVRTYEKVGFARHDVNNNEMNAAVNGLKEIYIELKKEGGQK